MAAEQFDPLLFAEPQFAQTYPQFRRSSQFLDAHHRPGLDLAERTNRRASALTFQNYE
jgi:hypothetical protein